MDVPVELGLFSIFVGSIIAINILGFTLEEGLHRSGMKAMGVNAVRITVLVENKTAIKLHEKLDFRISNMK